MNDEMLHESFYSALENARTSLQEQLTAKYLDRYIESKEYKQHVGGVIYGPEIDGDIDRERFISRFLSPKAEEECQNAAFDSFAEFAKRNQVDENTDFLKAMAELDYSRLHLLSSKEAFPQAEKIFDEFIL